MSIGAGRATPDEPYECSSNVDSGSVSVRELCVASCFDSVASATLVMSDVEFAVVSSDNVLAACLSGCVPLADICRSDWLSFVGVCSAFEVVCSAVWVEVEMCVNFGGMTSAPSLGEGETCCAVVTSSDADVEAAFSPGVTDPVV